MLTLLCGADRLATSAALLCAVRTRAEAGKGGNILIVPEQYSHETERALCRAGGDTISRYAEVLSFTRLASRVSSIYGGVCEEYLDEGGRLLKTTGTLDLQLHRPGLEAERTAEGGLKVTLYTDGNLDGVAEKVVLRPEQYTCAEEADGALTVTAKKPYKGSCRLEAEEKA